MAALAKLGRDDVPGDWAALDEIGAAQQAREVAAARTRESVRPSGGRAGEGPTIPEAAMMAVPVARGAQAIGRAISAAPKTATGLSLGAILGLGTGEAGGQEPNAVRALQTRLRDAGHYSGPIDGIMGRGTQRAQQDFLAAERERDASERETKRTAADAAAAQARQREAELASEQMQYRDRGSERLREMENDVPWYRRAVRDYAAPVGIALGALGGVGVRHGVVKASDKISQALASRAEALLEAPARGLPARTSRVNEFWRRGGAQADEIPFVPTPGTAPGVAVNPGAAPIGGLYQPPTAANRATDIGITAGFGADAAVGQGILVPQAQEELRRATEAASADPSEVNIRALQSAKDRAAIMEMITNAGRAGLFAYPGAAMKIQRSPTVPSMNAAEAERLAVDSALRGATTRARRNQ